MRAIQFEDGDLILALRALRAQLAAGQISQAAHDAAFAAHNQAVGQPCADCGQVPAVIIEPMTGRKLCGRCGRGRT